MKKKKSTAEAKDPHDGLFTNTDALEWSEKGFPTQDVIIISEEHVADI